MNNCTSSQSTYLSSIRQINLIGINVKSIVVKRRVVKDGGRRGASDIKHVWMSMSEIGEEFKICKRKEMMKEGGDERDKQISQGEKNIL